MLEAEARFERNSTNYGVNGIAQMGAEKFASDIKGIILFGWLNDVPSSGAKINWHDKLAQQNGIAYRLIITGS